MIGDEEALIETVLTDARVKDAVAVLVAHALLLQGDVQDALGSMLEPLSERSHLDAHDWQANQELMEQVAREMRLMFHAARVLHDAYPPEAG